MTLSDFPNELPAVTLDFLNSRQLDPRINFSRASAASPDSSAMVDGEVMLFDPNVPRLSSTGLLIEENRTNSCIFSENFTGTNWSNLYITPTPNATTAPDGTNTASSLMETADDDQHRLAYATQLSTINCTSIFVKPNGRENVAIEILYGGNGWMTAVYNLTGNGAVTQVSQGGNNAYTELDSSIIPLSNGWYRLSLTTRYDVVSPNPNQQYPILLSTCTSSTPTLDSFFGTEFFPGDPTKGVYIWGAQFELEKNFPTSYIPTAGTTATRAADVAEMPVAGAYNVNEYTIINQDFGAAGGSDTLTIVGTGETPVKRTAVYNSYLTQEQTNAVADEIDDWWEWRVLGESFGLAFAETDGQITIDWGDGSTETLSSGTTGIPDHTFTNGSGYHTIKFKLDSGTYFETGSNGDATNAAKVTAVGPCPSNMLLSGGLFSQCINMEVCDATFVKTGSSGDQVFRFNRKLKNIPFFTTSPSVTSYGDSFRDCELITSFPSIDLSNGTNFTRCWADCSSLESFPAIDLSAGNNFYDAWGDCTNLVTFPANMFNNLSSPVNKCFTIAWSNCNSLNAAGVENILNSIDTSGQSAPASGPDITIDYNASSGTPNITTAVTNLKSRGWTITLNGVLQ